VTRVAVQPNRLPASRAQTLPRRNVGSWRVPPVPDVLARARATQLDST
jgi:hypothetical protein